MSQIRSLSKIQKLFAFLVIALNVCVLISVYGVSEPFQLTSVRILALAILEASLLLVLLSTITKKFVTCSVAIFWLLLLNFLITPFLISQGQFVTLPKNLSIKTQIVGDTMPGLSEISRVTTDDIGFRVTKKIDYIAKGN